VMRPIYQEMGLLPARGHEIEVTADVEEPVV